MTDGRMATWQRAITLTVSAVLGLSALGGGVLAVSGSQPLWFFLAFEIIVLVAAVFGVVVGRGRFSDAPALSLLCVAGSVAAATLFGFLRARDTITVVDMQTVLLARWAACGVLGCIAGWTVLARRPAKSLPLLARGMVLAAIFFASLAAMWWFRASLKSFSGGVQTLIAGVGGIWLLATVAPATHYIIRAFEQGRLRDRELNARRA